MEIMRAIERADALCPNPYTLEEKLCWCDEVSGEIRRNILKIYGEAEALTNEEGKLLLPENIPFERVECVFIDNMLLEKQDLRSFFPLKIKNKKGKKLRIVYLDVPERIRKIEISGTFDTSENVIEIDSAPFVTGDKLGISQIDEETGKPDFGTEVFAYVYDCDGEKLILDREVLESSTEAELFIRRIITDTTEIDESPYDTAYIEFILAKIALYQHDYTGYNAHMTQYNALLDMARRDFKTRNPLTAQSRFKNYSII